MNASEVMNIINNLKYNVLYDILVDLYNKLLCKLERHEVTTKEISYAFSLL